MPSELTPATETPSQPVPVESSALPEPAEQASVNWEGISDEMLTDEEGTAVEGDLEIGEAGPEPEGFAKPAEPVVVESVANAPPVAAEPAQPAAPSAPVKVEPAVPFDAVAWEKEQLTNLEQLYQLTEAEQQAFLTEPENTLPKLAAAIHMKVTKAVLNAVQGNLPQMIQQHQSVASTETAARSAFYEANPDLADPAYEPAILQVGQMFRKMNPTAPREEATKKIGELVRVSMGLSPVQQGTVPSAVPVGNVPPAAPRPFTPARGGSGAGVPVAQETNIWAALASEMQDET